MPFSDFLGNPKTVHALREMLARDVWHATARATPLDNVPHAVILSGAHGSGKYTLALMLTRALNCLEQPVTDGLPDFCGRCVNCNRRS